MGLEIKYAVHYVNHNMLRNYSLQLNYFCYRKKVSYSKVFVSFRLYQYHEFWSIHSISVRNVKYFSSSEIYGGTLRQFGFIKETAYREYWDPRFYNGKSYKESHKSSRNLAIESGKVERCRYLRIKKEQSNMIACKTTFPKNNSCNSFRVCSFLSWSFVQSHS